ncbi:MAG: hypothetical protein JWS12_605 [Candidatus Saccharibacteria bacterium]|nr:hypothetical protein [Candidatus Saccharibacteria bacterium]
MFETLPITDDFYLEEAVNQDELYTDTILDHLKDADFNGGEPATYEEVAKEFGLTRERIRQIEARVMSKLRHPATIASLGILGMLSS